MMERRFVASDISLGVDAQQRPCRLFHIGSLVEGPALGDGSNGLVGHGPVICRLLTGEKFLHDCHTTGGCLCVCTGVL